MERPLLRGRAGQSLRERLSRLRPQLGSSVLRKVLAALVAALAVSSAVTLALQQRLTEAALREQGEAVIASHLEVLRAVYASREEDLLASVRGLSQELRLKGLDDPARRHELYAELGRAQRSPVLDFLQLLGPGGGIVAAQGEGLPPLLPLAGGESDQAYVRLLRVGEGRYVQVAFVPLASGEERLVLAGGYEFDDRFAYRLRGRAGYDVILVADGYLTGSTLTTPLSSPPLLQPGRPVPQSAGVVTLGGTDALVQYAAVSRTSPGSPVYGAIGVAFSLPEPVAALDRSLGRSRLIGSAILAVVAVTLAWVLFSALTRPLGALTRTARRIAEGDLDATFAVRSRDEIGVLSQTLERMRVELRSQLEVIGRQASALQQTSKRIATAQDEERHRLAMDLHDGIQQQLVVLRMSLGLARERVATDPASAIELCDELGAELDRAIERLREVSHDIYPSILLDRGLTAAVRSYAGRIPLSTRLVSDPDPLTRLEPEIESSAYFLVCEAVTNALKHAGASALEIELAHRNGRLDVLVADDGRGIHPGDGGEGGGLVHMQDRVHSLGGDLEIVSSPDRGVQVRASFPARPVEAPVDGGRSPLGGPGGVADG